MVSSFLVAGKDFVGDLGNFFLLQGFSHVDEVGSVSLFAGAVEVAHVAQSHDVVPAQVFLKYIQHLLLLYHLVQFIGILFVGDAQQQAVVIFHEVEQIDKSGAGQEVAVVVVYSAVQRVIEGVERSRGFQQFHLVVHAPFAEHAHGFGGVAFGAVEGDVLCDDFLHALFDGSHVFQFDGAADAQIAEVTFRHRMLYVEFSLGKEFADSLVEDETERTDVSAHARWVAHVEKFDVFVVIDSEIESFGTVVDLGAYHLIGKIKIKSIINIQKCASSREVF